MRSVAKRAKRAGEKPGEVAPLIRALRLAAGLGCWPIVERVLQEAYGPSRGTTAIWLLRVLLQGLALGARRPLRLGFVGAPALTHDERALLQMIAAARQGDSRLLEAGAAWLVRPAAALPVTRAASGLAALER